MRLMANDILNVHANVYVLKQKLIFIRALVTSERLPRKRLHNSEARVNL